MERLPGFRDFYPEPLPHSDSWSADARQFIFEKWRTVALHYNFREYDGPPLESLELFTTKSGDEIVGQLYNFTDKGDRAIALRPEMTPTLARMIAAHERNYKKPIKWFAIPQLFRYERQQKGRLREHFQFNADLIGETNPAADAELIALLIDTLRAFGLTEQDFIIRLSSRNAWHEFYEGRRQKAEGRSDSSHEYDFFQAIDKLERVSPEESETKLVRARIFTGRREPIHRIRRADDRAPEYFAKSRRARPAAVSSKLIIASFEVLRITPASCFEAFDVERRVSRDCRRRALRQPRQTFERRQGQSTRARLRHGRRGASGTAQGARPAAEIRHRPRTFLF
jgi:histidyl-tRNA synthetase